MKHDSPTATDGPPEFPPVLEDMFSILAGEPAEGSTVTFEELGEVCVDTATLLIVDPCQLDTLPDDVYPQDGAHREIHVGACRNGSHPIPVALSVHTGIGDGRYPVIGEWISTPRGGRFLASVTIEFLPTDWFQDDDEDQDDEEDQEE